MARITVTPQVFFELFILCLSWQWDENRLTHMWTTVDKVVHILVGLGVLTDKQRKLLSKDRRTQELFAMKCGRISALIPEGECGEKHAAVLASEKYLVVSHNETKDFSRERLLRDYRMYLSARGKDHAALLEAKYADILTREAYRAEEARQDAELPPRARAAVSKRYRRRVEEETAEE